MNYPAETLFDAFHQALLSSTKTLASRVRTCVGTEQLSPQQHKELETIVQTELESLIWNLLGSFDNVGGSLPSDILDYRILATLNSEDEEVEFSDDEQDYAVMWSAYLSRNRNKILPLP